MEMIRPLGRRGEYFKRGWQSHDIAPARGLTLDKLSSVRSRTRYRQRHVTCSQYPSFSSVVLSEWWTKRSSFRVFPVREWVWLLQLRNLVLSSVLFHFLPVFLFFMVLQFCFFSHFFLQTKRSSGIIYRSANMPHFSLKSSLRNLNSIFTKYSTWRYWYVKANARKIEINTIIPEDKLALISFESDFLWKERDYCAWNWIFLLLIKYSYAAAYVKN